MAGKPLALHGWRRRDDGVVVGVFGHQGMTFLRRELTSLHEQVCWRLASMPVLWPFGEGVGDPVSAALPEDPVLRAVLANFYRGEPEWALRWYEIDFWCWLEYCVRISLAEGLVCAEGWVELHDREQVDAVASAVGALAAIAEYRSDRGESWLWRCAGTLATVDER